MYKVSNFLVSHFWGNPGDMADALGVLLLTWNQAFYRYGSFDFDKLEAAISKSLPVLKVFRERGITTLSSHDEPSIKGIFLEFLDALRIDSGSSAGKRSPVAVSKALHLLAPQFLPLWDDKIAKAYGLRYSQKPAAEEYVTFCRINKYIADQIKNYNIPTHRPLLKLIDQYNYSKYTQGWV
ncbi:MAG: hypothetical protein JXL84_23825 [Deltaproteobacteria bacterium]|nr:hypothetical protein [Deltaproteobacteria bacterium]